MSRYDVIIANGTVVDGTGAAPRVADLAVSGGRVARIGSGPADADRVIDAAGKLVMPGFVDFHGHSDYSLLVDPEATSKVMQGVTTECGGNCGYHAAPVAGSLAEARREEYARSMGLHIDFASSAQHRARLRAQGSAINYAQQIGYNSVRSSIAGDDDRPLSASERDAIVRAVREEYDQGAVGLSYGIAYVPACFASIDELVDVAHVTAEAPGAFTSFHLRNEDGQLLEALDEAIAIGRASGAAVHIGHLKTFGEENWSKLDAAIARLEAARAGGMDLTVDRYPHLAMNTQLKFALPPWSLAGGPGAIAARLRDPATRGKIVDELRASVVGRNRVLISVVSRAENKHLEGRFLDELPAPFEILCDLLLSEGEAAFASFFGMSASNLDRILALDYAMVASDASVQIVDGQRQGARPHPRCFDTFPLFLASWAIDRQQLPLAEAVRRITSLPARRIGLVDRGLLAEGAHADVVVLDPRALETSVSYAEPVRFPRGIQHVLVNGQLVVDEGQHTHRLPGALLERSR